MESTNVEALAISCLATPLTRKPPQMEFSIKIEKSFEGEYRGVVRKEGEDFDLITMPWVCGQDTAMKMLGILFSKNFTDVLYAFATNTPLSQQFLKTIGKLC